jgi:hypothetical protein
MVTCFDPLVAVAALGWADRSRLESLRKLSRTLKEHFHGVLASLETRLTNAAIQAINGFSKWLSALRVAFPDSITSASPLISKPAVLSSTSLILYPFKRRRGDIVSCVNSRSVG